MAFDLSRVGIVFLNTHGRILRANPELADFLGYTTEELRGHSIIEVTHPDDRAESRAFLERAARGSERSLQIEKRYVHKHGETRWGLVTCTPIFDTHGHILYLISHVQNITESKRIQTEQRYLVELLELLNTDEPVRELIRRTLIFLQTVSGCEAVGIRLREGEDFPYYETRGFSEEFVQMENSLCATDLDGQLLRDTVGSPVLDCMCGNVLCGRFDPTQPFFSRHGSFYSSCTSELLATTSEADRQARTRNRCNGEGYESVALIPLRSGGNTFGLLQFNDRERGRFSPEKMVLLERLTDNLSVALAERRIREQLQTSEARYRLISEAVTDYLYRVRIEGGRVVETCHGEGCVAVTGYSAEEFARDPYLWLNMVPESDRAAVLDLSQRAQAGECDLRLEHRILRQDGSLRWVLNTLVPRQKLSGEVYAYEGLIQDITDRKQLESKLREGELRYRSIVEGQTAVIFRLKPSGICSFANERFCEVFGKDRADLVGTAWFPQTDPPGANIVSALISEPTIAKPVYEVECRVLDGRSQWRWYEFVSRGLFDENGWMTETQVVGRDITKQKLYEEALHKNQELTQRILQTVPNLVYIYDLVEKRNIFTNQETERFLGYSPEQVRNMGSLFLDRLLHPEDKERVVRQHQAIEKAADGDVFDVDYRIRHVNGEWRYFHSRDTVFLRDGQGRVRQILGSAQDVTERRRAEAQLAHSHNLMRYVIEHANSAIAIHDRDLRYIYVSDRYLRDYHVRAADVIGRHHYEVFPDLPQKWRNVHQLALAGVASSAEEDPYVREDGSVTWTRWKCRPWYESDGAVGGIIVYTEVITERKRIEQALRESEGLFSKAFYNSPLLMAISDLETGRFLKCNETFLQVSGFSAEECIGKVSYEIGWISPEERQVLKEEFLKTGRVVGREVRLCKKGGEPVWCLYSGEVFVLNGEKRLLSILTDITESKRLQDALQASENRFRSFMDNSPAHAWAKDAKGRYVYYNRTFQNQFGIGENEWLGKVDNEIWPGDFPQKYRQDDQAVLESSRPLEIIEEIPNLDGSAFPALTVKFSFRDAVGSLFVGGIALDITLRVRVEEQLRQYMHIVAHSRDMLALLDTHYVYLTVNGAFAEAFQRPIEDIVGRPVAEVLGSSLFEAIVKPNSEICMGGKIPVRYQAWLELPGTGRRYLDVVYTPYLRLDGAIQGFVVACRDMTDRKLAEEQVIRSEQFARSTLDGLAAHIAIVESEGRIEAVNRGWREFAEGNGLFVELACEGANYLDVCEKAIQNGEQGAADFLEGFREVLDGHRDLYEMEYPCHSGNEKRWFNVRITRFPGRDVPRVVVAHQNCTDRKLAEEALRASQRQYQQLAAHLDTIREEERAGIAREIHDELGQALTALRLDISKLLAAVPETQKGVHEKLAGMILDIEKTTDVVHRISSELRPGMLDDLGIGAAAEWLVQDFEARTGLHCQLSVEPEDLTLDEKVSTALYRVLQEALTNIVRHAQADSVQVRLQEQKDEVILEIEDNGVGIRPEQSQDRQSWGIIGMRERVRALDGEFSVEEIWEGGTRVLVRIPVGLSPPD